MKKLLVMLAPLALLLVAGAVYLIVLLFRALSIYVKTHAKDAENAEKHDTLSEAIKAQRIRCNMTQEYVAEALGVSRQAVSKWENGSSAPSTANLIALAQLYGISVEELLR